MIRILAKLLNARRLKTRGLPGRVGGRGGGGHAIMMRKLIPAQKGILKKWKSFAFCLLVVSSE